MSLLNFNMHLKQKPHARHRHSLQSLMLFVWAPKRCSFFFWHLRSNDQSLNTSCIRISNRLPFSSICQEHLSLPFTGCISTWNSSSAFATGLASLMMSGGPWQECPYQKGEKEKSQRVSVNPWQWQERPLFLRSCLSNLGRSITNSMAAFPCIWGHLSLLLQFWSQKRKLFSH